MLITSRRGYLRSGEREEEGGHTEFFSFPTAYRILVGYTCRFFVRVHTPEDDMMQGRGRLPAMYSSPRAPRCIGRCALLQEQKIVVTQPVAMLQEAPKMERYFRTVGIKASLR